MSRLHQSATNTTACFDGRRCNALTVAMSVATKKMGLQRRDTWHSHFHGAFAILAIHSSVIACTSPWWLCARRDNPAPLLTNTFPARTSRTASTYMGFAFLPSHRLARRGCSAPLMHHFGEVAHQPQRVWWNISGVGISRSAALDLRPLVKPAGQECPRESICVSKMELVF